MSHTITRLMITSAILIAPFSSYAALSLPEIQSQWAKCQYQTPVKDDKIACLETLVGQNKQALETSPDDYQKQVWLAINLSSLAGAKGGLGALSLVKQAKSLLENVIKQQPQTLDGSAFVSLGSLYYQVPGWPVGFGSDKKAELNLKKALAINPQGIDANYFYGDFLLQDGRKADAKRYLETALAAPARPGRETADQGRRMEIRQKLEELAK